MTAAQTSPHSIPLPRRRRQGTMARSGHTRRVQILRGVAVDRRPPCGPVQLDRMGVPSTPQMPTTK